MELSEIISAAVGGAVAAIPVGLKIAKWFDQQRARSHLSSWRDSNAFLAARNRALSELREKLRCNRVLLVRSHNSGDDVKPGSHIYISVVDEKLGPGMKSVIERVQNRAMDDDYRRLVHTQLLENGFAIVRPEDFPERHWLRDMYESLGIKVTYCKLCTFTGPEIQYLVANITGEDVGPDSAAREAMRSVADIVAKAAGVPPAYKVIADIKSQEKSVVG